MLDLKLMIVEDDELLRKRLDRILGREVSTVKSYASPAEALDDLQRFKPDLVLTDIKMPKMSGLEMVEIIRESFADIPVIIASAFSEPELFKTAIKLKVENYVVKPVDMEELLKTIQTTAEHIFMQKKLRDKESLLEQYKHIVDISANIIITDKEGIITYVNDRFCILSGFKKEELIGRTHKAMRHPDMSKAFYQDLWDTILKKKVWQGIIKNRRRDGSSFYGDTTIAPILDADGDITEFIAIKTDITDLISSKKQLQDDIVTDRLTRLPNRIKLQDDIHLFSDYTLLLIDIDHFKDVNLLFGIHFGDAVLKYFAQALRHVCVFDNVTAYRIASDEFVMMSMGDTRHAFSAMAYKLKEYIEASPLVYEDVSFELEFSCAYMYSDNFDLNPIEQLQGTVVEAKRAKHFILEHNMKTMIQKQYEENFEWTKKIKEGLHDDRVIIHFQPIYDIRENCVKKFESLVRLVDPNGNIVPPGRFLSAAKRSRYYKELTCAVIQKACATFKDTPYSFSINLSIEDLTDDETLDFLIETVTKHNLQDQVIVEVLESEGIDNFYVIQTILNRLNEVGLKIAIDDFGSGYSNYAYLVNLPISLLKIDGSLIKNIVDDNASRVIVQSIIMFAHELGMKVIAEFVADHATLNIVRLLGIDFAQGYHIGKPGAAPDDSFCVNEE